MKTGCEYDEFGNFERDGSTSFLNDTTFTSSITDTSTGLQYMNSRYYNPKTGRFLSQDTYSGSAYEPWTQHLYAYCGNNPTNMIDPTGHSIQDLQNELDGLYKQLGMRQQFITGYSKMMSKYSKEGNWDEYDLAKHGYERNTLEVAKLAAKIDPLKKQLAGFKDLQRKLDNGQHDQIHQANYKDIPLFDDHDVAATGCGYIAAIIAASKLGAKIDVHDAYLSINKPGNEFFNTGAVRPSAISSYLLDSGFYPTGEDYDMEPDSVYIAYYHWSYKDPRTGEQRHPV